MHLSIVSPVYRAQELVEPLVRQVSEAASRITDDFEIVLVEDGGPDRSWEKIEALCDHNPRVRGIRLSRNFGQHAAITAGLRHCSGDWVVVMDCDLQDRPQEIPKLYDKAQEGFDVVLARRTNRQDPLLKRLTSKLFFRVLSSLSGIPMDPAVGNFGIYRKSVIEAVANLPEPIRIFSVMVRWVGFQQAHVDVEHARRPAGKSSYTYRAMFNNALNYILAYSDKPLRMAVTTGVALSLVSILAALVVFMQALFFGAYRAGTGGWASVIISIWFSTGLIIMVLGILGLYVGKIFEAVKDRPIYIVHQVLNGAPPAERSSSKSAAGATTAAMNSCAGQRQAA